MSLAAIYSNTLIVHTLVKQFISSLQIPFNFVPDDLDISVDFFSYMAALQPLLDKDPTVWCISTWNDNGKKDLIDTSANS